MKENVLITSKHSWFFQKVTTYYKPILVLSALFIIGSAMFLPKLTFDTGQEAFIDDKNPVLVYRDKVKATFGLKDPMVIAIHNDNGVFNVESLKLIAQLGDSLELGKSSVRAGKQWPLSTLARIRKRGFRRFQLSRQVARGYQRARQRLFAIAPWAFP